MKSSEGFLKLKAQYGPKLLESLVGLAKILQLEKEVRPDFSESELTEIAKTAHRIRGTAGTYGYFEVSVGLKTIEQIILRISKEQASDQDFEEIADIFDEIQTRAEQRSQEFSILITEDSTNDLDADQMIQLPSNEQKEGGLSSAFWVASLAMASDDEALIDSVRHSGGLGGVRIFPVKEMNDVLEVLDEIDGVIIDGNMEDGVHGIKLAGEIKKAATRKIPIAWLVHHGGFQEHLESLDADANYIITLPVSHERLQDVVQHFQIYKEEQSNRDFDFGRRRRFCGSTFGDARNRRFRTRGLYNPINFIPGY